MPRYLYVYKNCRLFILSFSILNVNILGFIAYILRTKRYILTLICMVMYYVIVVSHLYFLLRGKLIFTDMEVL